jgi:glycosyltransferase involved in cell wall biosynthesis
VRAFFLSPYAPWPVRHGGHNRAWSLIRALSRLGAVHVFAIGDPAEERSRASIDALGRAGVTAEVHAPTGPGPAEADPADLLRPPDALSHFRSPTLARALADRARAGAPDLVLVFMEELVMAQYADGLGSPLVIDRQKIEWRYHEALAAMGADAAAHRAEAARFRRFDESLAGRFAAVLVTGRGDAVPLEPLHGADRVHVVPIAVDDRFSRPADRTAAVEHVVLYGTVDYPPNALANASYFREVWPVLQKALPALRTLVVGSGAPPSSLPAADPRVEVRGFVEDIAPVLQGPGVLVVPLRVGGGSRTKILEALACGMPVVATEVAVENLGLLPGRHYLRAETPAETAEAVLRLVRDPALAEGLGREGAARIDAAFRQAVVDRDVERVTRGLRAAARVAERPAARRALLVGVHPLPDDEGARSLSFPGHRTAQFRAALRRAGCAVLTVLLDEEGSGAAAGGADTRVLSAVEIGAGRELQRAHDAFGPEVVVAAGGYHAARAVSGLTTDAARWIDLPGDLAAEGQLRAADGGGDAVLADYLAVLDRALAAGDRFSVVGPSQRLALLGQLGARGRLAASTTGCEPVAIVPVSSDGPAAVPPLPEGGPLRVLSAGGYNTWLDTDTMFAGLEEAMARCDGLVFVSTGGPVFDGDAGHRTFWERARASRFAARFLDRGRVTRAEAREALCGSHVALSIARRSLEAELGSRQRAVEAAAHGRPVVITGLGDLARSIDEAGAGLTVPAGDARALADALVRLAADRTALATLGRNARAWWEGTATPPATTAPLEEWVARPSRWPAPATVAAAARDDRLLKLQSELDHIRRSRTFRALRLLDRWLGRGR